MTNDKSWGWVPTLPPLNSTGPCGSAALVRPFVLIICFFLPTNQDALPLTCFTRFGFLLYIVGSFGMLSSMSTFIWCRRTTGTLVEQALFGVWFSWWPHGLTALISTQQLGHGFCHLWATHHLVLSKEVRRREKGTKRENFGAAQQLEMTLFERASFGVQLFLVASRPSLSPNNWDAVFVVSELRVIWVFRFVLFMVSFILPLVVKLLLQNLVF